jgi:hypothetical protein
MFGDAYVCARADQRPKYGSVNVTLDPSGIGRRWSEYGSAFFSLKPHMRERITITTRDSSQIANHFADEKEPERGSTDYVATPESCAHLLTQFHDIELRAAIRVATGRAFSVPINRLSYYKEVQVPPSSPSRVCFL